MLRLRAHHLNCIPRFGGSGYSAEFCENMLHIQKRLLCGEDYELVMGVDDVCRCCPNLINGVCRDHEKVMRFDRQNNSAQAIYPKSAQTANGITFAKNIHKFIVNLCLILYNKA